MKNIISKILVLSLVCGLVFCISSFVIYADEGSLENASFELGDVNDDGNINAVDALFVLKHASKIQLLDDAGILSADVTADGTVNAVDALNILKYAAGIIPDFSEGSINPTPSPEEVNVQKIKEYVINNGDTDSNIGAKYLSYGYSEDPVYTSIYYFEEDDSLAFDLSYIYMTENDELGLISTIMYYNPYQTTLSFYVEYEDPNTYQYMEAQCNESTKGITADTVFEFSLYDSENCTEEEIASMLSLAPDYAATALFLWDDVLVEEIGLSLKDIGFTNLTYN